MRHCTAAAALHAICLCMQYSVANHSTCTLCMHAITLLAWDHSACTQSLCLHAIALHALYACMQSLCMHAATLCMLCSQVTNSHTDCCAPAGSPAGMLAHADVFVLAAVHSSLPRAQLCSPTKRPKCGNSQTEKVESGEGR
eukprot:1159448-Pelagomonas_calceolata.AAC.4